MVGHHHRAGPARDLHPARAPRSSSGSPGSSTSSARSSCTRRSTSSGTAARSDDYEENAVHPPDAARSCRSRQDYHGSKIRVDRGRQEVLDADDRRLPRPGDDGPAVRARQHPGDLRADPRAVHRLHGERVRADGAAPAVLPAGRPAQAAGLPVARARGHPRLHRRQAGPARRCTRTSCRSSTAASRRVRCRRSRSGCRSRSSSACSSSRPSRACSRPAASSSTTTTAVAESGPPTPGAARGDRASRRGAAAEEERAPARLASPLMRPNDLALLRTPGVRDRLPGRADGGRRRHAGPTWRPTSTAASSGRCPPTARPPARPLTSGARDSAPAFSPDGRWLAYLQRRAGGQAAGLVCCRPPGGAPRRLTDHPLGAGAPVWSPDSRRLAYAARVPEQGRYGTARASDADAEPPRLITTLQYRAGRRRLPRSTGRSQVFVARPAGRLRRRRRAGCPSRCR